MTRVGALKRARRTLGLNPKLYRVDARLAGPPPQRFCQIEVYKRRGTAPGKIEAVFRGSTWAVVAAQVAKLGIATEAA